MSHFQIKNKRNMKNSKKKKGLMTMFDFSSISCTLLSLKFQLAFKNDVYAII